jgi:hypothetical protein
MSRSGASFPAHWHYYLAIKSAVIGAAVVLVLKLLGGL